jgi:hypothetical protein
MKIWYICTMFKTTISHNEIRLWIQNHGGKPAVVRDDSLANEDTLTIAFDDAPADVSEISWGEFFDRFETRRLALRYPVDEPEKGPRDYSLISRDKIPALSDRAETDPPDNDEVVHENQFSSEPNDPREL